MSSQITTSDQYLEQTWRESDRKFRALAEASGAAVFIYEGTRLCYVNSAASILTGYSATELLRMNFYDLALPEERKRLRAWGMRTQREADEPQKKTFTLLTKTGEKRQVRWTAVRIEHNGRPAVLGVVVDIPAREDVPHFKVSNRHANNVAVLYEIARDLTLQRNRSDLLYAIADHAMKLTNLNGCVLYLYDAIQDELEAVETKGAWDLRGERLKIGADLMGRAAETRQIVTAENYRPSGLPEAGPPASFAAAIPLIFGGELKGGVLVYGWGKDGELCHSQEGMRLLTFFADISAIALNNAALLDETRQRLIEIEVLYQASLAATQIHSVRAVAQRIVETLERLMGWQVSLWVLDAEQQRPSLLAYGSSHSPPEERKEQQERTDGLLPSLQTGIVGWVCRTGQTVRANDVRSDPRYVEGNPATRSELCAPLKIGGRVIGCINMESPHENAFSEHDERLLTTLANQAAIAMENARLVEETRRHAARQSALNEIVMAAAHVGTELDAFLKAVLDHTLQAFNLDIGALWLMPDDHRPYHVAMRGIPASLDIKMVHWQTIGEAELSRVRVVSDWSKETGPLANLLTSLGIFSSLVIPLYLEDRCVGGLAVAAPAPRRWAKEEVDLAKMIAQEIGGAAERMRLFEETRARLQELEAINRVSVSLRIAHSLNEMLSHLLEESTRALGAQAGGVWLYDKTDGRLRLALGHDWVARLSRAEAEREDGIARTVFSSGDIYFSHDLAADPLLSWPARTIVPSNWSALYVPINTEQETIGVLMIADRLPRAFSASDARLMATLAEVAGNAIQRMILYEQTQRHALELEQRVAERTAELQEALQKAQEADRLKSEFLANINHELRTPLTNLVLYYQMLRAQPHVQTEERLDVIGREIQRLRALIEDLLNLSRLDSGRVSFTPMPHNLNQLLEVLIEDRRLLAKERNLELLFEMEENLPPVFVDAQMISQAFSNLLTNALHYTPRGGRVCVRTMLGQRGDGVYAGFSVQDTGPGVDPEELPHIFERFYRGRAGRESPVSGTGLGLAIVKQVVEYHKGEIEVANGLLEGQGASFTVWLPLDDSSTASPAQARS